MKRTWLVSVGLAVVVAPAIGSSPAMTRSSVRTGYGNLPLAFEPNRGQADPEVSFLSRVGSSEVLLTPTAVVMSLRTPLPAAALLRQIDRTRRPEALPPSRTATIRMTFAGARAGALVEGRGRLPGRTNYLFGNDPRKWVTGVPQYAEVRYSQIYPGIDVVFHGAAGNPEYDFIVSPGADPSRIALRFDGARVRIDSDGRLALASALGELLQPAPRLSQRVGGRTRRVPGGFELRGDGTVGFNVGGYDVRRRMVIDPVILYSTYLGGFNDDGIFGLAVDAAGSAYVTGVTGSGRGTLERPLVPPFDFPTTSGSAQPVNAFGFDAFITKFDPTGSDLVYSTFLGGQMDDFAYGIAVDSEGSAYVTGPTCSTDFPTVAAVQPAFAGGCDGLFGDAFVAKLDPTGSAFEYSTYLGGVLEDLGSGIAVDSSGAAYVTGPTWSDDFPIASAIQPVKGDFYDAFVTKLGPAGALVYSTFLGGNKPSVGPASGGEDFGVSVAVDASGNAYVAGSTSSFDFPVVNAFQPENGASNCLPDDCFHLNDAFVAKIDASGTHLVYSSFLGGREDDILWGIAIDPAGRAYGTGAAGCCFPLVNELKTGFYAERGTFVSKIEADGSRLLFSTYLLGAADGGEGRAITVDGAGNVAVTGLAVNGLIPLVSPVQSCGGGYDAYVATIDTVASKILFSSYLGGHLGLPSTYDEGFGIAVRGSDLYVGGFTWANDFPVTLDSFQPMHPGYAAEGFLTKIGEPSPGGTPLVLGPSCL